VLIVGIQGGSRERLESLGLVPGVSLRRLSASPRRGPIVVERGGSGFALAYSLAEAILVEPAAQA
jgi:Fe2+ transport system protein FeoA